MLSFWAFHASGQASPNSSSMPIRSVELLMALAVRFPSFDELITADRLKPSFTANLNGDRFISDPGTRLGKGDSVLILSADAGG